MFQLRSVSAICIKYLQWLQTQLVEVPGTRLSYTSSACVLQGVHYFNLRLAYCIKPQKCCH